MLPPRTRRLNVKMFRFYWATVVGHGLGPYHGPGESRMAFIMETLCSNVISVRG